MEKDQDLLESATQGSFLDCTPDDAWRIIRKFALSKQKYHTSSRSTNVVEKVEPTPFHVAKLDGLMEEVKLLSTRLDRFTPPSLMSPSSRELIAPCCDFCGSQLHISSGCSNRYEKVFTMPYVTPNHESRSDEISKLHEIIQGEREANNEKFSQLASFVNKFIDTFTLLTNQKQEPSCPQVVTNSHDTQSLNVIFLRSGKHVRFKDLVEEHEESVDEKIECESLNKANVDRQSKKPHGNSKVAIELLKRNEGKPCISKSRHGISHIPPGPTRFHQESFEGNLSRNAKGRQFQGTNHEKSTQNGAIATDEPLSQAETPPLLKEIVVKGSNSPSSTEQGNNNVHGASLQKGREVYLRDLPFSKAFIKSRKHDKLEDDQAVIGLFSKIEVNIPLIKLVKQVPAYSKFLKELYFAPQKENSNLMRESN